MMPLLRSLRPEQWLKNGFVLAPLVFSGSLTDPDAVFWSLVAVAAFCAAASATYLVNDVLDREADRGHPTKCRRPIASGDVSVGTALVSALILIIIGGASALALGGWFPAILGAYMVITLLYSTLLKQLVFVDVLVVALGFVLRV
ncbi:MAG: UbiA family prenyltransferase, partial [Acidobacteriota bacterium]